MHYLSRRCDQWHGWNLCRPALGYPQGAPAAARLPANLYSSNPASQRCKGWRAGLVQGHDLPTVHYCLAGRLCEEGYASGLGVHVGVRCHSVHAVLCGDVVCGAVVGRFLNGGVMIVVLVRRRRSGVMAVFKHLQQQQFL